MTRLNKELKETIISNAIAKAGIPNQFKDLEGKKRLLAEDTRLRAVGGIEESNRLEELEAATRKIHSEIATGLQSTCNHCLLVNYSRTIKVRFGGSFTYLFFGEAKVAPDNVFLVAADDDLAIRYFALENEESDVKAKKGKIESSVREALDQVKTVKQLLTLWKEAETLLPKFLETKRNLPMVQTVDLNALVGLGE